MPTDRDARSRFRIQQPCPLARLDALEGDGPRRHCPQCDRTVHDLSSMTRREAARLRQQHLRRGERLCGMLRQDQEGRVQLQPGPLERLTQRLRALPALAILFQPGSCAPPPTAEPEATAPEAEATATPEAEVILADPPSPQDAPLDPELQEMLMRIGYYID